MNINQQSSKAQDRTLSVWFQKLQNGEIKLPRFQRFQAWDKKRITSLLETITYNLPLGITLLLEVDEEKFISRYLATAPETGVKVNEHLLDGQQRLTSLWRSMHNPSCLRLCGIGRRSTCSILASSARSHRLLS